MTFEEYEQTMDKELRRPYPDDLVEFDIISDKLPKYQEGDCGYCTAHNYRSMRLALYLAKPRSILEIGFNLGHSSMFWLRNTTASMVSVDVKIDDRVMEAVRVCENQGKLRFCFMDREKASHLMPGAFDFAFIDGAHDYENVVADILWCCELKIPYLFFDDWLTIYGDVQRAVLDSGLKIICISGNQVLVTSTDNYPRYYGL